MEYNKEKKMSEQNNDYDRKKTGNYNKKKTNVINSARLVISYKDPDTLRRFISEKGKINPRKYTNITAKQQRLVAQEIKRARYLGLLPNNN